MYDDVESVPVVQLMSFVACDKGLQYHQEPKLHIISAAHGVHVSSPLHRLSIHKHELEQTALQFQLLLLVVISRTGWQHITENGFNAYKEHPSNQG